MGTISAELAGWYGGGPGGGEGFDLVIVAGEQDVGNIQEQGEDVAVEAVGDEAGVAGELVGAIVEHGPGAAVEGLAVVRLERGGVEGHPGAAGAPAAEVPVAAIGGPLFGDEAGERRECGVAELFVVAAMEENAGGLRRGMGELGERVEGEGHVGSEVEADLGKPGFGDGEGDAVADVEREIGVGVIDGGGGAGVGFVLEMDGLGEDEEGAARVALDDGLAELFFCRPDVAEVAAAGEEDGGVWPGGGEQAGAGSVGEVLEGAEPNDVVADVGVIGVAEEGVFVVGFEGAEGGEEMVLEGGKGHWGFRR